MKEWEKVESLNGQQVYDRLLTIVIGMAILAFIFGGAYVFVPIGLALSLLIGGKLYDRYGGNGLRLANSKRTIRLFPGESSELKLQMANASYIPLFNGQLTFESHLNIGSDEAWTRERQRQHVYTIPLSLISRQETAVTLPVHARKRGVTRFRNMEYRYPHLTQFSKVTLRYRPPYQTEMIVYPEPIPVKGIEDTFQIASGSQTHSLSPYENILTPIGTRDYVSSDPFHRVHWKASAKKQQLQTKVLEREADISWTIIVHTSQYTRLGNQVPADNLEELLSYACYVVQQTGKKDFNFELAINMRRADHIPFYYLPEGNGFTQVRSALELLARVNKNERMMAIEEMLHRVNQQMYKSKMVLLIGEVPDSCLRYIQLWRSKGIPVYHIATGVLTPFGEVTS